MQTLTPFLTIFHRKTLILVKNKNLAIIKRSVGGVLTKTLYKGVSGGFTMSNNLFNTMFKNRGIGGFYLANFIKSLPTTPIQSTQDIYDSSKNIVFSIDKICHKPIFAPYTDIIVETTKKGFDLQKQTSHLTYLYPWKQHLLAHLTYKKVYNSKEIVFYKKHPELIDASSFDNTGMTLQNFVECHALTPLFDAIYNKYNAEKSLSKVKIRLQNYEKPTNHKFQKFSGIQANPDAIIELYIVENGQILKPVDAKIIQNPVMVGSTIGGNVFTAMPFEKYYLLSFIERMLATIASNSTKFNKIEQQHVESYILKLSYLIRDLRKMKSLNMLDENTINNGVMNFQQIILDMLLDPKLKEIVPSLLFFSGIETNVMHNFNNEDYAHFLKNGTEQMYPQALFPPMGSEDTIAFRETAYAYVRQHPEPLRSELHAQLDTFLNILDQFPVKNITWK